MIESATPTSDPAIEGPWLARIAIACAVFLAFVAGTFVMHFEIFPAEALERGYKGGAALWDRAFGYRDPFDTDFWKRARTEKRRFLTPLRRRR